jgi:hypothetical protein
MLGEIPPFAGEISGFVTACVACVVQDAHRMTAPIAAAARSVTNRLTWPSCALEGCLCKKASKDRASARVLPPLGAYRSGPTDRSASTLLQSCVGAENADRKGTG